MQGDDIYKVGDPWKVFPKTVSQNNAFVLLHTESGTAAIHALNHM